MTEQTTLAFIFNENLNKVLLIKKSKGVQKGMLNGVGGKMDDGESFLECMYREIKEETPIDTQNIDLDSSDVYCYLHSTPIPRWYITAYRFTVSDDILNSCIGHTTEEGVLGVYDVDDLPDTVMPNLKWLIPLAVDSIKDSKLNLIDVEYENH